MVCFLIIKQILKYKQKQHTLRYVAFNTFMDFLYFIYLLFALLCHTLYKNLYH